MKERRTDISYLVYISTILNSFFELFADDLASSYVRDLVAAVHTERLCNT